jgi:hypothetical protein
MLHQRRRALLLSLIVSERTLNFYVCVCGTLELSLSLSLFYRKSWRFLLLFWLNGWLTDCCSVLFTAAFTYFGVSAIRYHTQHTSHSVQKPVWAARSPLNSTEVRQFDSRSKNLCASLLHKSCYTWNSLTWGRFIAPEGILMYHISCTLPFMFHYHYFHFDSSPVSPSHGNPTDTVMIKAFMCSLATESNLTSLSLSLLYRRKKGEKRRERD